jgi:monoamine oxidase
VRAIDWSRRPLRVESARGTVEAGVVVITASPTALAAGVIRFDPPLPAWKLAAFEAVPLGSANKVGLRIPKERLGVNRTTSVLVELGSGQAVGFQLRPFDRDLANAYLAGPVAAELEREGPRAMVAVALAGLKTLLGSEVERWVDRSVTTAWGREPWIRGAYAAARPGEAHRRHDLAAPLADRLLFAGEATHPSFYSTAHGAHMTGVSAAVAAARALGRL